MESCLFAFSRRPLPRAYHPVIGPIFKATNKRLGARATRNDPSRSAQSAFSSSAPGMGHLQIGWQHPLAEVGAQAVISHPSPSARCNKRTRDTHEGRLQCAATESRQQASGAAGLSRRPIVRPQPAPGPRRDVRAPRPRPFGSFLAIPLRAGAAPALRIERRKKIFMGGVLSPEKKTSKPQWPANSVKRRSIGTLAPYAGNARTHSDEQVDEIARSMAEFGWTIPILLDERGEVIAGHGRLLAAQKLGFTEAPCMVARGWSEAKIKAYRLADNEIALHSDWNPDLLKVEFEELKLLDFELELTGFSAEDINQYLAVGSPPGEETYSRKLDPPIYTPKGDKPKIADLFDDAKEIELKAEIRAAKLPAAVARFLEKAAERHTVFEFRRIAEYYAHAPAPVQRLMERSGLVIIDFDSAIENGFVKLTERLAALAASMPEPSNAE